MAVKILAVVFALLLVAGSAEAARRRCPPRCAHRTCDKAQTSTPAPVAQPEPAVAARASLWDAMVEGFELQAGFRWEQGPDCRVCPVTPSGPPPVVLKDPFFLGAGVRLPLRDPVGLAFNFDRDFTEAPHWQARLALYVTPFRGARP